MRVFQEEIFGRVASVAKFKDDAEVLSIANDTFDGLGAGVWTRNGTRAYRFGRETHKMMLNHYQQTKNALGGAEK